MPIENLEDTYVDRCISACNLYVKMYNRNMASEIANGICLPLGKEFKQDRFKSMCGKTWVDEYDNFVRWDKIKRIGEDIEFQRMVS